MGFGKAVLGMADELQRLVGNHIVNGILSVPVGAVQQLKYKCGGSSSVLINDKIR